VVLTHGVVDRMKKFQLFSFLRSSCRAIAWKVEEDRLARVGRVNGVVEVVYLWSSTRGLESVGEKCRVSRYYCDNRFWLSFCCCPVCVLALAVLATLFCVICTISVDYTELGL